MLYWAEPYHTLAVNDPEYLEEEDAYGYPVNGRESLLAVIMIDKSIDYAQLRKKISLLHSIIENVSMALERIEVTVENILSLTRLQDGKVMIHKDKKN